MNRFAALSAGVVLWTVVALPSAPLLFGDEQDLLDEPDKRWRRGPVQYILTREEDKQFKKLGSDEERRGFIAEFWDRRDPTPGTEENEFKEQYARRLAVAQETFGPPEGRGWEEDRGKIVLLLGPPDSVRVTSGREGGGAAPVAAAGPGANPGPAGAPGGTDGGPALRPRAVFVYEDEVFPGGPTPAELEFIGEGNGGYRLLTRVDLSDPRLTGLEPLPYEIAAPEPAAPEEPVVAMQEEAPPPPAPPSPGEELMALVLSEAPPDPAIDLTTRIDFYKTREEDTFATLTVSVKDAGDSPIIAARLVGRDEEVAARLEEDGAFSEAEGSAGGVEGTDAIFQGAHNLSPGMYSLITAVKDPASGRLGIHRQEVEVPDYSQETLQMSTVTLARKVEPAEAAGEASKRFVLGNYRVIPAPAPVFRAGQDLILYYQVYNTAEDAGSGRPKLKVTYQFAKVESTRKIPFKPITQEVEMAIQIYGVTIAEQWPEGDYQVEVAVEDLVAGSSVSSVVPFTVKKED